MQGHKGNSDNALRSPRWRAKPVDERPEARTSFGRDRSRESLMAATPRTHEWEFQSDAPD
jgi:hypothetical protein